MMIEVDPLDDQAEKSLDEWTDKFKSGNTQEATAELAAKFMFAMSYYHERMRLHILLHPLFFVAGFLAAYWTL
jgi:hypothetical protein|tara:strand:- start:312 stop:530 length:219 start_codon:yes stop_codon:yes gene_type:complete